MCLSYGKKWEIAISIEGPLKNVDEKHTHKMI